MLRKTDIGVTDHAMKQAVAEDRCGASFLSPDEIRRILIDLTYEEIMRDEESRLDCPDLGDDPYEFRAIWDDERLKERGHLIIAQDQRYGGKWVVLTVLSESVFERRRRAGKKERQIGLPPYLVVFPNGDGEGRSPADSKTDAWTKAQHLIQRGKPATRVGVYQLVPFKVSLEEASG